MTGNTVSAAALGEARWRAVAEISAAIAQGKPLEETLTLIVRWQRGLHGRDAPYFLSAEAAQAVEGKRPAGMFLFTPDKTQLQLHGGVEFPPAQMGFKIPSDYGLPGLVAQTNESLLVTNTDHDPRFVEIIKSGRVGSTLQVPIRVKGECVGLTFTASMAKDIFWPEDQKSLEIFADLAAIALMAAK